MGAMRTAIMSMHEQINNHDTLIKNTQKNDNTMSHNLIGVGSSVLKRVEESEAFMVNNLDVKIATSERRVLDGV